MQPLSPARTRAIVPVLLAILLWCGAAVLARDLRPWAIALTDYLVAGCLVAGYAAAWAVAVACAAVPQRRRMWFRAVASTMLIGLLWLLFELPALVGVVNYADAWYHLSGEWRGPSSSFMDDPHLGFRHIPNTRWEGRPRSDMAEHWNLPIRSPVSIRFSTDSRGFRNARDMDRADIVLLGDSYIEGSYVSDDETCAVWLERWTGRPVANLAQSGYGTLQELVVLERFALAMQPRLVVWFFFEGNDLYNDQSFLDWRPEPAESGAAPAAATVWNRSDFVSRSFTRTAFLALRRLLHPVAPNSVATAGMFRDDQGREHRMYFYSYATIDYDEYEQELFERTKEALRRGRDLCREQGVDLVVFYIPMKFRVYGDLCTFPPGSPCVDWKPWDLVDYFGAFCDSESIAWVDLTVPMRRAAAAGEVLYAPEDSHWNQRGQEFVAREVERVWERYRSGSP